MIASRGVKAQVGEPQVLDYKIDRSAVPALYYNKLTLKIQVGNITAVSATVDGVSTPVRYDAASGNVILTTAGTDVSLIVTGGISGGQFGTVSKAVLEDDKKWAWSHGMDDNVNLWCKGADSCNSVQQFVSRGYRATLFIITNVLDTVTHDVNGSSALRNESWIIDEPQLQQLIDLGWGIGNHDDDNSCSSTSAIATANAILSGVVARSSRPNYRLISYAAPNFDSSCDTLMKNAYGLMAADGGVSYATQLIVSENGSGLTDNIVTDNLASSAGVDSLDQQRNIIKLYRESQGYNAVYVKSRMDYMSANSNAITHRWLNTLTHSDGSAVKDFVSYFDTHYGTNGTNEAWMAPEDEIYSYILVRDYAVVTAQNVPIPTKSTTSAVESTLTPTSTRTSTPTLRSTLPPTLTRTSTPARVGSGLVAAYNFDEGASSTVNDLSGNGNNGTVSSPAWTSAGKFGGALTFGAAANRVTVPDAPSLDLTTGMTVEAWVYPTAALTGNRTVVMKEQASNLDYVLYANMGSNRPQAIIYAGGARRTTSSGTQLPTKTWTHLAMTYNGVALKLFQNGTLLSSTTYRGSIAASANPLSIGGNSLYGEDFSGSIDEVRIYNRALSAAEIALDMNTPVGSPPPTAVPTFTRTATLTAPPTQTRTPTRTVTPTRTITATKTSTPTATSTSTSIGTPASNPTKPAAAGLVAAYSFNEGSGNLVTDKSGNGNNGTVSSPSWTTAGKFGSALTFSTSARRVVVPDANSLDLTTGMTLEAWVYPTTSLSGWNTVIMKEQPGELVYALYANGDSSKQYGIIYSSGAERETSGGSRLAANTWAHVAVTYNGSTIKVYKDGTLLGSYNYSGSILTSTGALDIGGNSMWGEYFNGRIDEVRVYNRELTASEIMSDMNTPIE